MPIGNDYSFVASFTDAWIETLNKIIDAELPVSHLLQMRGLKLRNNIEIIYALLSHLLQMRGLKPILLICLS